MMSINFRTPTENNSRVLNNLFFNFQPLTFCGTGSTLKKPTVTCIFYAKFATEEIIAGVLYACLQKCNGTEIN